MNKKVAIIFLLILAVGIVSLFFTFKHLKKERETLAVDEQGNTQPVEPPSPAPEPAPVEPARVDPKPPVEPEPTPPAAPANEDLFRSPEKLLGALTDLIKARDAEAFIALAGEDAIAPEVRPALVDLLNSPDYEPAAVDPIISLARIGDLTRWAIQLDPVATPTDLPLSSGPVEPGALPSVGEAEIGRAPAVPAPGTATTGPSASESPPAPKKTATTGPAATPPVTATSGPVSQTPASGPNPTPAPASPPARTDTPTVGGTAVTTNSPTDDPAATSASASIGKAKATLSRTADGAPLPPRQIYIDLGEDDRKLVTIEKVLVPMPASGGSTMVLPPSADPVTVAHGFARAVLSSDFKTARAFSDPEKITDERIAALMIALEEGAYKLQSDRPLIQTLARDTVSWIVARVQNAETVSEFGLEMSKLDPNTGWRIDNMSFDKVIQMTATAAGGGNVAYAPIVKNPQGGDSLVVFFEFDSAALNVRAQRQVRTIADILKGNPSRQIKINGHADALGLDDYNSALSARRAQTVRNALTELGVASDQIVATGLGASVPLSPNFKPDGSDNPSGRSQNRRSEIYLDF